MLGTCVLMCWGNTPVLNFMAEEQKAGPHTEAFDQLLNAAQLINIR